MNKDKDKENNYKITNFTDLDVWKKSYNLVLKIYKITEQFPSKEQFGITSQIRRASTSICANIAEGFSRFHYKDRLRFYYQSRGSLSEVENFIYISFGLKFITNNYKNDLLKEINIIKLILNGLIKSTEKLSKKSHNIVIS